MTNFILIMADDLNDETIRIKAMIQGALNQYKDARPTELNTV